MSYKSQHFEWEVRGSNFQKGEAVGYEIELARNETFNPILYSYRTFEEDATDEHRRLYYSLDGGSTWILFPSGDQGKKFYAPYMLRFEVTAADTGDIFAENNGTVYRIRPDGKAIIETYTPNVTEINGFCIHKRDNSLFLLGEDTAYRLGTDNTISPYDNSINLRSENAVAITVDGERQNFWQIDKEAVCLKDLYGEEIFCVDLPIEIDVDWSSSSSSSSSLSSGSSLSSSSSSIGYSSLSSSSTSSFPMSSSSSWSDKIACESWDCIRNYRGGEGGTGYPRCEEIENFNFVLYEHESLDAKAFIRIYKSDGNIIAEAYNNLSDAENRVGIIAQGETVDGTYNYIAFVDDFDQNRGFILWTFEGGVSWPYVIVEFHCLRSTSSSIDSQSSSSTFVSSESISTSSSEGVCGRELIPAIPPLTNYSSPSPYVVYSSIEEGTGWDEPCSALAWRAFNQAYPTGLFTQPLPGTFSYLVIDMGVGNLKTIRHYQISTIVGICEGVYNPGPIEWKLQASNSASPSFTDDTGWTDIHHASVIQWNDPSHVNNCINPGMERCYYDIGNVTAYRFYRLKVIQAEGVDNHVHIANLILSEVTT